VFLLRVLRKEVLKNMAHQDPQCENSQQPNRAENAQQENMGYRSAKTVDYNPENQSVSTAGDTANGKGSKTDIRKEEKEANDNYDYGRKS
jgi:hypothetical protein